MSIDRFEQDLPELLAELAPRAKPDYRDDIVRQTARMRQRPAWMFPERWLPMSAITTRGFAAPPIPWRVVGVVALLVLALALGLAILAGSRPKVPPPFGPAGNGVVGYEAGGDIFTADPVTGVARAVVSGVNQDLRPVFSRDGTHMAFEREEAGSLLPGRLVVTRSDGTGLVVLTPNPVTGFDAYAGATPQYTFSPDGSQIALWSPLTVGGRGQLWIAQADGSGLRQVDTPLDVLQASWLPPDGARLIVTASTNGGPNGIFVLDPRTSQSETVVAPDPGAGLDAVRLSPDGTRLAYTSSAPTLDGPSSYRVHVVGLDGSNNITLPLPAGAVFQDAPAWSNDGTRLAITRGYAQHDEEMAVAVVPADGSDAGVESTHGLTGCCNTMLQWSPDDSTVLVMPALSDDKLGQHLLVDPLTGASAPAPWTASTPPAWQRTTR